MKPTINTGTLSFSHLRTRNGPFLFQKCHPLNGESLRANDTNPGGYLAKQRGVWLCMRARSIHRRGEASLAGNVGGIWVSC